MHRSRQLIALMMCLILLAACGYSNGPDTPPATPASSPVANVQKNAGDSMTIGQVIWAESTDVQTGAPDIEVEAFTTESPAIIAVVEVGNVPAGTEFVATWTINDAEMQDATMHVESKNTLPEGWVAFRFTRSQGKTFPTGVLTVKITSNTGEVRESWIEITFP